MHNKTILTISSLIIGGLLLAQLSPLALAQGNTTTVTSTVKLDTGHLTNATTATGSSLIQTTTQATQGAITIGQRNLAEIIKRADTLIDIRINDLNSLITRIQNDTRLTEGEKQDFIKSVQDTISNLTTLKSKIDADSNLDTALTDIRQIYSSYRVYEIFVPKTHMLLILNNLQEVAVKLKNTVSRLQNLIATLESQGKDVTILNGLVTDINSQLTIIQNAITKDIQTTQAVDISTSNPGQALQQVKQDIQNTIRPAFQKIRSDITQIRQIVRALIPTTPTPSAMPTSTPSPTPASTP